LLKGGGSKSGGESPGTVLDRVKKKRELFAGKVFNWGHFGRGGGVNHVNRECPLLEGMVDRGAIARKQGKEKTTVANINKETKVCPGLSLPIKTQKSHPAPQGEEEQA